MLNLGCVINSRSSIRRLWFYSDADNHQEGWGELVFETVNKEKCVALLWCYTSRLCNLTLTENSFDAVFITIKNATLISFSWSLSVTPCYQQTNVTGTESQDIGVGNQMSTYQTLPLLTIFNIIQRLKITVYLNYLYKFNSTQQKTQSDFVTKTDLLVVFKFWYYCATVRSP